MVVEKIRGFSNLKKEHQQLFIKIHTAHQNSVEDKSNYQPTSVKWCKSYLKVTFANGEWLHYMQDGTWY